MTQVKKCNCGNAHEFQDGAYGKGNRVVIPIKGVSTTTFRCTVCGHDFKDITEPPIKKTQKKG